jgi:hypothetical protein
MQALEYCWASQILQVICRACITVFLFKILRIRTRMMILLGNLIIILFEIIQVIGSVIVEMF